MTSEQFTYWLQGFFELTDSNKLSEKQVQMIKDHLQLVFTKITPDYSRKFPDLPIAPYQPIAPSPYQPTWFPNGPICSNVSADVKAC